MGDFRKNQGFGDFFPTWVGGRHLSVTDHGLKDIIDTTPDDRFGDPVGAEYVGLAIGIRRLQVFLAALLLILAVVVGRTVQIQSAPGKNYSVIAEKNRIRLERVPTERGIIYDFEGRPLVMNVPSFAAAVTPSALPSDPQARRDRLAEFADRLDIQPTEIENAIRDFGGGPSDPVVIAEDLSYERAVLVSIESAKEPGLSLQVGTRRAYPLAEKIPSLSHVLGYEGRITRNDLEKLKGSDYAPSDTVGKAGLEKKYESVLRGTYGSRRVETDAAGRTKRTVAEEKGTVGQSVVLALDMDLQREAEAALRDGLKAAHQVRGSVIAIDPRSGAIRALVSLPSYDGNLFAKGNISSDALRALMDDSDMPLFPRAIGGSLPAGSTFKPVVAAAALEERLVTPTTSFMSTGGLHVGQWTFPDWKAGGHGLTDLGKAIAESVNTYFYVIGGGHDGFVGLGPTRIAAYARKFGFGSTLGIDLPGESAGFMPTPEWKKETRGESWYIGDTYHIAIGQGDVLVTPLQIAAMTMVIANGGTLYRPRLAEAFLTADGKRQELDPEVITRQVVSRATIEAVQKGMRQTVTQGSARSLGSLPVQAAGKTGTAQWNSRKANHAWFTSFAPYAAPELVVTVNIEEGGEGSSVATPVAKRIYRWYFGGRDAAVGTRRSVIADEPSSAGLSSGTVSSGTEAAR